MCATYINVQSPSFQINIDGVVSFQDKFDFPTKPTEMPVRDRLLVAPLWAQFDGSLPSGKTADYATKKNMVSYIDTN